MFISVLHKLFRENSPLIDLVVFDKKKHFYHPLLFVFLPQTP